MEHAEHGQANAAAEEEAERKVAVLNTRVQQLESQLHHAMEECQELSLKAQAAAAGTVFFYSFVFYKVFLLGRTLYAYTYIAIGILLMD